MQVFSSFTLDVPATPDAGIKPVVLRVDNATCTSGSSTDSRDNPLFSGLSFCLHSGEILDLTGASGAGKSSLLTLIAQLNPRGSASLMLNERDSTSFSYQQWRRHVAYLPQKPTLIGHNVAEAIRLPWTLKSHLTEGAPPAPNDIQLRETLDTVGCDDIELERSTKELSGGQMARICLLRTLLTYPDVLLADEVDAGLDSENALKVSDMLVSFARKGMAICRIRHRSPDGRESRTLTLSGGKLQ